MKLPFRAKLTDQSAIFALVAAGLLLHYGRPPEGREHNTLELCLMAFGAIVLALGVGHRIYVEVRGSPANSHERNVLNGLRANIREDQERRGNDG